MSPPKQATWYSCNNSNCVEVANQGDRVLVRDSKATESPILSFTRTEWDSFREAIKAGDFDHI
jgi:hypothetical protein